MTFTDAGVGLAGARPTPGSEQRGCTRRQFSLPKLQRRDTFAHFEHTCQLLPMQR